MGLSISAVVPIYNEQNTVGLVVSALIDSKIFNEIICVNDGSDDNTLEILESFGSKITLINILRNKGKGYALAQGVKKANTALVAFIDADFTNLCATHLELMLSPIKENGAEIVIGNVNDKMDALNIFDHISGQRIYYKKDIVPFLDKMEPSKYGVEIVLNELSKSRKTTKVFLQGLVHVDKYAKYDPITTLRSYIKEAAEIALELGKREIIMPHDLRILGKLEKEKNLAKIKHLITLIKNNKIKSFLIKYFEKYFTLSKK